MISKIDKLTQHLYLLLSCSKILLETFNILKYDIYSAYLIFGLIILYFIGFLIVYPIKQYSILNKISLAFLIQICILVNLSAYNNILSLNYLRYHFKDEYLYQILYYTGSLFILRSIFNFDKYIYNKFLSIYYNY